MKIIDKNESEYDDISIIKKVLDGAVFVYPTDTIYGIGCDATNFNAVSRLRIIKKLPGEKPMSVIAPDKQWIMDNCVVDERAKEWLDKLPGAYTLILKLKNKVAVAKNVNFSSDTIGIRIPKHWISTFCKKLDRPIITTSANIFGQSNMTCLDDLDGSVKTAVDFIIYDGELNGHPSALVYLNGKEVDITKR